MEPSWLQRNIDLTDATPETLMKRNDALEPAQSLRSKYYATSVVFANKLMQMSVLFHCLLARRAADGGLALVCSAWGKIEESWHPFSMELSSLAFVSSVDRLRRFGSLRRSLVASFVSNTAAPIDEVWPGACSTLELSFQSGKVNAI